MHCIVSSGSSGTTAPERGKRNPKRLAGASANGRPEPGCSCAAADQWRGGRSQQGWAPTRRVVVVSEQQNPEGLLTHRNTHAHTYTDTHTHRRKGRQGFRQKGMNAPGASLAPSGVFFYKRVSTSLMHFHDSRVVMLAKALLRNVNHGG